MNSVIRNIVILFLSMLLIVACRDHTTEAIIEVGNVTAAGTSSPFMARSLGDIFYLKINSDGCGWTASCNSDWIHLSQTSGVDGDILSIDIADNPHLERRYGVIRFYDINDPSAMSDHFDVIQSGAEELVNSLLTDSMSRKHRMGFGYDILGEYMNDKAFSEEPVLDYNYLLFLENLGTQMVTENYRHIEELEIESANTLTELRSKLTKNETTTNGTFSWLGCSKTTTDSTVIFKQKTIDQECGMIRLKQIVTSRTIDMGGLHVQNRGINANIFSVPFRTALKELSDAVHSGNQYKKENAAQAFYQQFGTHLVVSADLGGEIRINTVIDRETSIESTHSVSTVSKRIFGKRCSPSTSRYDDSTYTERLRFAIELQVYGGTKETKQVMQDKVKDMVITNQITDDDIINWQNSFQLTEKTDDDDEYDCEKYNAALVDCRLVPLYDIIDDAEVTDCLLEYCRKINGTENSKEPDVQKSIYFNVPNLTESGSARCVYDGNDLRAVIAREYVPAIRSDKPCVVAYPIVCGRPFMYCGVFVGDSEHLPGFVRWVGNNCLYEPNEQFESDSLGYKSLLDDNGQLKRLYVYWGAVQMVPNEHINATATSKITVARAKLTTDFTSTANPEVVKVGPHYWVPFPLEIRNNSSKNLASIVTSQGRYTSIGNNPDTWGDVISQYKEKLPNASQASSVMAMLNGRVDVMANEYYSTGENLLSLKWPRGYLIKDKNNKQTLCDQNSWVIPTYEGKNLYITRLSMSGSTQTMNLGDYLQSVGFLDNQYEKYVPFFFCTDEVY